MRPSNPRDNRGRDRDREPLVKKQCYFCSNKITTIYYGDAQALRRFMSPHSKILNHARTGTCPKHQRVVTKALKRARHMALLPFVAS